LGPVVAEFDCAPAFIGQSAVRLTGQREPVGVGQAAAGSVVGVGEFQFSKPRCRIPGAVQPRCPA